jgi:hypothetical protein
MAATFGTNSLVMPAMDESPSKDRSSPTMTALPRSPLGHRLMFFMFAMASFVLFAPLVLLPLLKEHCELLVEERQIQKRNDALQAEIDQRAQLIEDFAGDSSVNEKLAMIDLQYRKPNEEVLPVLPKDYAAEPVPKDDGPLPRSALQLPDTWPRWALQAESWGQEKQVIDLFLDERLRPILLLMSAGLVIAAFVLFAPKVAPPPSPASSRI